MPALPESAPGPHGGDAVRVAAQLGVDARQLLDLSASLNPFAPAPDASIGSFPPDALARYPDDTEATGLLASAIDVDADRVVLTNGGAEAIALVASLERVGDVVEPDFSLYARHLAEVRPGSPRWRSNPSNPLGRLAESGATARVWDEAFWPLAVGTWTRGDDDAWRLGSLTKLWACPGVRLGYAIAPSATDARRLRRIRPRWSVNALALHTLTSLLPVTTLGAWSAGVAGLRSTMVAALRARGLDVVETDANWVLVDVADLRARLLEQLVLVRDCASFGMPGTARIAVPDANGLDRLLAAIDAAGVGVER